MVGCSHLELFGYYNRLESQGAHTVDINTLCNVYLTIKRPVGHYVPIVGCKLVNSTVGIVGLKYAVLHTH